MPGSAVAKGKPIILGVGDWRTGTISLSVALRKLGLKNVYHFTGTVLNDGDVWMDYFEGRRTQLPDFVTMYEDVDAILDGPMVFFWREVFEALQGAGRDVRVIHSIRKNPDPMGWVRSMHKMKTSVADHVIPVIARGEGNPLFIQFSTILNLLRVIRNIPHHSDTSDEANAKRVEIHTAHMQNVREFFGARPEIPFLEYRSGDGWGPLCRFLSVPVPSNPYPRLNASVARDADGFCEHDTVGAIVSRVPAFLEREWNKRLTLAKL